VDVWREVLRVLKPGGHLLAFAGTRTQHRMAVAIEDAGFEIRDMIAWVYGSGFPKSLDVSKAIDKAAGAEREVVGPNPWNHVRNHNPDSWSGATRTQNGKYGSTGSGPSDITAPATPAAQQWSGWGTALKPALEPITVARKPFKGTVAANVLEHGTGAINVDGCRLDGGDAEALAKNWDRHQSSSMAGTVQYVAQKAVDLRGYAPAGRWPANLIHDGSDEPCALLSDAARFFYCAKASKADRGADNSHPTVKPTELMRYLCRLVTPPGGVVLDPFMGSGSTGKAAVLEGFRFIGIEREAEYLEIARGRIQLPEQGSLL
jgi:site-specific DNA-methyltransferase (adenine-specific)